MLLVVHTAESDDSNVNDVSIACGFDLLVYASTSMMPISVTNWSIVTHTHTHTLSLSLSLSLSHKHTNTHTENEVNEVLAILEGLTTDDESLAGWGWSEASEERSDSMSLERPRFLPLDEARRGLKNTHASDSADIGCSCATAVSPVGVLVVSTAVRCSALMLMMRGVDDERC
jgi:hypothetical protein